MNKKKTKAIIAALALLMVAGITSANTPTAPAKDKNGPDLPSPLCDRLRVGEGNKLHSQVYAGGVQIYRWDGLSWVFVEPSATLFANAGYDGKVGKHYAGPTWESNSGSKVVGARMYSCQPDTTAIPWLLLEAVSTSGPGIYSSVTYIQRVNTKGGLAPAGPGSFIGETVQIPYTAEYYFYSEQ
jgi:hypothetical protein